MVLKFRFLWENVFFNLIPMNNHVKNETFLSIFKHCNGFSGFQRLNSELYRADDEGLDVCHGKEGRWHRN